jgi:hypothetical protein
MTTTQKKSADLQSVTLHGRIAHMELVSYNDQEFLSVSLMHTISDNTDVRVRFTNSNGLLTAYRNNTVVVGQELTISGGIKGIRSFYMKDDVLMPLKNPELQFRCNSYAFGSKPQQKVEQPVVTTVVENEFDEIPF